jgi:hypothetical protein
MNAYLFNEKEIFDLVLSDVRMIVKRGHLAFANRELPEVVCQRCGFTSTAFGSTG